MHDEGASDNPSLQNPRGATPPAAPDVPSNPSGPQATPRAADQRGPIPPDRETHPLERGRRPGAAPVRRPADKERPFSFQRAPTLSKSDLRFVAVMLAAILLLSGYHLVRRYGWSTTEVEVLPAANDYRFTIDINSATWVEWLQLEGVGEVLARRIVEHREQHGPFRSIDDLNDVRGIGDVKLEAMRPYLTVGPLPEVPD